MQDRVTGGQAQRYRGSSIPRPNPADYGCITLPGGTPLTVERGHEMTVILKLPDGHTLRGVTHPDMIK